MAGVNSTAICFDDASLQQCSSNIRCSDDSVAAFHKTMGQTLWRVNTLVLINAVLAGVIVAIGAFAQRYRHQPFTRFIFLGATTLLLPITSYVVSTISTNTNDYVNNKNHATLAASCRGGFHYFTAVSWAFLIQIIMINTRIIVAVDDREGRNKGPAIQLLVQGIWTIYLGVSAMGPIMTNIWQLYLEVMLYAIICAKTLLKCFAFLKSRKSYAFGRNPRLISWYMAQLQRQEAIQPPLVGEDRPTPLLVMGEEDNNVVMGPHGYIVNTNGIVTINNVWEVFNNDDFFQSIRQLKDMCLSFSLFKLLRCRFARYENADYTSMHTIDYFWNFLLRDGNHKRLFRVIADELSFVQDYYFSSLPVSYSKYWLPILSISISLLSITYCILATRFIIMGLLLNWNSKYRHQLRCGFWCNKGHLISDRQDQNFGFFVLDDIPLFILIILVALAELKYVASYIFSNWTKVALICHYINHAALQHSFHMRKCFSFLLQCKWEGIMKHWDEKMGQSSILVLHPRTTPLVLLRHLLRLPDLDRSVEIPDAVKVSIFDTLRRYRKHNWHRLGNGTESLRRSPGRNRFLLFCSTNSTSDTILTWHIATCILELYQYGQGQGCQADSDHKVTATLLSRYCTYLMAWSPDLLPDDAEWSKSLYKAVKEDTKRALVGFSASVPESEYEQVVQLLSVNFEHEVLRNGVRLAVHLVELTEGEAWMMLSEFWSEMILYIAPSENVRGHLGAIARGGELITLLWALLTHAGIMHWPAVDLHAMEPMEGDEQENV